MNKIFKVIWNHTTQSWIAVSELGKSKTKSKSKIDKRVSIGLIALGAIGLSGNVLAATVDGHIVGKTKNNNLVIGGDTDTTDKQINQSIFGGKHNVNNTVIGIGAKIIEAISYHDGNNKYVPVGSSIVVGHNATVRGLRSIGMGVDSDSGYMQGSVVIGYKATGDMRTAKRGNQTLAYDGAAHLKYRNPHNNQSASGNESSITKDGTKTLTSIVAIGANAEAYGGGLAIGDGARTYTKNDKGEINGLNAPRGLGVAIGNLALSHAGGLAIGPAAEATGLNSLSFGLQSVASGKSAIASGVVSAAVGDNAISIGNSATSMGARAIAIGGAETNGRYYDAANRTLAGADKSIAFGAGAIVQNTTATNSIAMGTGAYVANASSAISAGNEAYIDGTSNASVAIGKSSIIHQGAGSVGLGENTHVGSSSNASAIGNSAKAFSNGTIAFGHNAFAGGKATDEADKVLTDLQKAYDDAKAAHAKAKTAATQYAMDYAYKALEEAKKANEILKKERDAIAAAGATDEAENSIAIGTNTTAIAINAIAMGKGSKVSGISSIAIGTDNIVKGNYSGAFGDPSIVEGTASYTFGNDNVVGSSTTGAFVLGNRNRMGAKPTYIGGENDDINTVRVDNSKALAGIVSLDSQDEALRDVSGSVVIGNDNTVTSKNTFILGNSVNTIGHVLTGGGTVENSVYLGSNSTAVAGAPDAPATLFNIKDDGTEGDSTTGGDKGIVNDATVAGIDYQGFQGNKADGVVTVGSADHERRIQNVAAGEISATSTDAINGSQLYLITKAIGDISDNNPFSYSIKEGDKNVPVTQVDGKFYKDEDLANLKYDPSTQKFYDAKTGQVAPDPKEVPADKVNISSAVDGETDTPSTINNVKGSLPATYNDGDLKQDGDTTKLTNERAPEITKSQTAPNNVGNIYNNAATVGDVLNAGWNLRNNGKEKDFVKAYDTVNFVDGIGTTVEVETLENGKVSNIKVNTATQYTDAAGNPLQKIGNSYYPQDVVIAKDGKVYPKDTEFNDDGSTPKVDGTKVADPISNPKISLVNADGTSTTPTVLGNVASGTETITLPKGTDDKPVVKVDGKYYNASDLNDQGKPKPDAKPTTVEVKPIDEAKAGLADLKNSTANNALTVADAKNLGWIVSSDKTTGDLGKEYADDVRNANEVKFVGKNGVTVSGKTDETTGVRTITVELEKGEVVKSNEFVITKEVDKGDGTKEKETLNVILVDDKYFKKDDIDPTTGKPKDDKVKEVKVDNTKGDKLENKGENFVTGNAVADAIQKSGFTVGKATDTTTVNFNNNNDERINPEDNLRFADGNGTSVSLGTVKKLDKDGNIQTTTVVKVDVDTGNLSENSNGSVKGSFATPEAKQKAQEKLTKAAKDLTDAQTKYEEAVKDLAAATTPEAKLAKAQELVAATTALNNADKALAKASKPFNKVATVENVVDAINKSGFTLKASAVENKGTLETSGTADKTKGELINPGKTVEMIAGKNMSVKHDKDGKITYATKNDVNFDSVQFGDNGPKIQRDGNTQNIKVGDKDGKPTKITNVADGVDDHDAVNMKQLKEHMGNNFGDINNRVNKLDKRMRGIGANVAAAASLPQVYIPGKSMISAAAGGYNGASAVAVGYSRASDNGKLILKLTGTANSTGQYSGGVGVGYQW